MKRMYLFWISCALMAAVAHAVAAPEPRPINPVRAKHLPQVAGAADIVLYVDQNAPPSGDGLSWATAYRDLQQALADAAVDTGVVTILVAEGTYLPDGGGGNPNSASILRSGLELVGGFPGGGADTPDPGSHPTVLSGDLLQNDPDRSDNASNVIAASGVDSSAVLDGFVVQGGDSPIGGGGMYAANGAPTVRNTIFRDNHSDLRGGAVFLANAPGGASFVACIFRMNESDKSGGAIYASHVPLGLGSCTFTANTCGNGFDGASDVGLGGAVYCADATLNITGSSFTSNRAYHNSNPLGGAVYAYSASSIEVTGSAFVDNQCRNSSGFDGEGGAIWVDESGLELTDCNFRLNACHNGGAVYCESTNLTGLVRTMTDCRFLQNTALAAGGAAYLYSDWTIADCVFTSNEAESDDGGALAMTNGTVVLTGCLFEFNSTGDIGGGARFTTNTYLRECEFRGNVAGIGGGIYVNVSVTAEDCLFESNSASLDGGGSYHSGSAEFNRCIFRENACTQGGGGSAVGTTTTPRYTDCRYEGNTARDGAGIGYWESTATSSRARIYNCSFVGNTASSEGGAIYGFGEIASSGNNAVAGCEFIGNSAARGGAISGFAGDVVNCTIVGNHAGIVGGLDALIGVQVANCVLWDNEDDVNGAGVEAAQINLYDPTVTHSFIQGLQLYAGSNNSAADPQFNDPLGNDGLRWSGDERADLADTTPAVNAGLNASVPASLEQDITGRPRISPFGPGGLLVVDAGAYEIQDCNGNQVSDDQDIAVGDADDCNGNGVPDSCEGDDCDGNGVLDACDIATGEVSDCNENGVPDSCEFGSTLFVFEGAPVSPFSASAPASWTFRVSGRAEESVSVSTMAASDLSSVSESVQVYLNDLLIGDVYDFSTTDCASVVDLIAISAEDFNSAAIQNGGFITIELRPVSAVGSQCTASYASVTVTATINEVSDCDANGVIDYCQILDDPTLDMDGTGVLDSCEAACVADITGDGVLNFDDINAFVLYYLASAPQADLDKNGVLNLDDIAAFATSFIGGCP